MAVQIAFPSRILYWRSKYTKRREQSQKKIKDFIQGYAEKLGKRELEQIHLFIAERSQLWIKSTASYIM